MSATYSCGCCGGPGRRRCRACGDVLSSQTCACRCWLRDPSCVREPHQARRRVVLRYPSERWRIAHHGLHGARVVLVPDPGLRLVRSRRGRR